MVIDPDYRGEIIVAIHNDSNDSQVINPGDRIAQFILMEKFLCEWEEVEELDDTERGEGGFGSTGK
jgi:dUTP pyrophosphatase